MKAIYAIIEPIIINIDIMLSTIEADAMKIPDKERAFPVSSF